MQDSDVKEIFSAIKMLKDKLDEHLTRIEELEKLVKSIEKRPSKVSKVSDPYSWENFINMGDYYELAIPIGNICMIEKPSNISRDYNLAIDYHKKCRAGGFSDWRLPTIDELEIIFQATPFKSVYGTFLSSSSDYYEKMYSDDHSDDQIYDYYYDSGVFCVR